MSTKTKALIAILGASFAWATAGVVTKTLVNIFDPFPLGFWRFFISSACLLPFFLKQNKIPPGKILKDGVPVALLSTFNIVFFYYGITTTTVNMASIIYGGGPFLITFFSWILFRRLPGKHKLIAIASGFIGLLIIVILPILEKGEFPVGSFEGNMLVVVAASCFALYTIYSKKLMDTKGYTALGITSLSMFVSFLAFAILTLVTPQKDYISPLTDIPTLLLMIHLSIIVTVVAYLMYQWAIRYSSPVTASFNNYIQTIFSIILAVMLLGEKITVGFLIGSLFIFAALYLAGGEEALSISRKVVAKIRNLFPKIF